MIPRVEGQETMQYGSLEAAVGLPDVEAAVIENLVSPSLGFFILAHICPDPAGLQYSQHFASNDGWKTQTELVYEDNFWGGNENWTNAGTVEYGRYVFQKHQHVC